MAKCEDCSVNGNGLGYIPKSVLGATINYLHEKSMDMMDIVDIMKCSGPPYPDKEMFETTSEAYFLECAVALLMKDTALEPTRSVLFRSAASIALKLGRLGEVKELGEMGLSGDPPPEIADEIRELMKGV